MQRAVVRQLYRANRVLVMSRDDSVMFLRRRQAAACSVYVVDPVEPAGALREVYHWSLYIWPADSNADTVQRHWEE